MLRAGLADLACQLCVQLVLDAVQEPRCYLPFQWTCGPDHEESW
ncbi:hypothetical protein LINGRAPRIM_LOCUS1270 [Linum grandiflorum]